MKQFEKDEQLRQLNEKQLQLASVMSQSDAHASKCIKLGLNFRNEYPSEYDAYEKAREEYNVNEEEIARIEAIEVEQEERHEEVEKD